ncbi:MAG: GNAT family N-acetyltransferase, partial [Limisphaerales bacterium]
TVTTTAYGADLAWIGMVLVHPDMRRRGIASALMRRAIDYLQAKSVRCIKLDATPDGEPVYARLGFQSEWRLNRWERECTATAKIESGGSEIEGLTMMDREAFGTDRLSWIKKLERDSRLVRVKTDGFGMVREGIRAKYVGPIMAHDPEVGCGLARELIDGLEGRTFWDIPRDNEACVELAKDLGFKPVRDLLRMWLGENVAGDPTKQFALGDPATG